MKKLYSCLVIAVLAIVNSCSLADGNYSETENGILQAYEDSELIEELNDFNNSLLSDDNLTRAWTAKQWLNVALADLGGAYKGGKGGASVGSKIGLFLGCPATGAAFGAFIGGLACGAGASWLASPDTRSISAGLEYEDLSCIIDCVVDDDLSIVEDALDVSSSATNKIELDEQLVSSVKLSEDQLNIGKLHNITLSILDGSVNLATISKSTESNSLYHQVLSSEEMVGLYNEVKNSTLAGEDEKIESKADYVIRLFEEIFVTYSNDNNDVAYIINQYVNIIDASNELTADEKEWIKIGLSTALYSFNYWASVYANE